MRIRRSKGLTEEEIKAKKAKERARKCAIEARKRAKREEKERVEWEEEDQILETGTQSDDYFRIGRREGDAWKQLDKLEDKWVYYRRCVSLPSKYQFEKVKKNKK